jgi:hypothetical protein
MNYPTDIPRGEYRDALIRWIREFQPSLFVTFVFNCPISIQSSRDRLEEFHQRIDRAILGPKWLQKTESRSRYIGFIEKPANNLHIHAVFHFPTGDDKKFVQRAPKLWEKLAPAGNLDIQQISHVEGLADYITKEIRPDTSEQILLPRQRCSELHPV